MAPSLDFQRLRSHNLASSRNTGCPHLSQAAHVHNSHSGHVRKACHGQRARHRDTCHRQVFCAATPVTPRRNLECHAQKVLEAVDYKDLYFERPPREIGPEYLWSRLEPLLSYLPSAEQRAEVRKALFVAHNAHAGQARKSGEPFITHPVEVARILAEMRLDHESIIAGLLHDTVEDTDAISFDDIAAWFGPGVRKIVEGETKLSKITKCTPEADQKARDLQQLFLAMTEDVRIMLVKLADRLHNMRTLYGMSAAKQRKISKETLQVFAPMAKLLGVYCLKEELEELSIKYLEPEVYGHIKKWQDKQLHDKEHAFTSAQRDLENLLEADPYLRQHAAGCSVRIKQRPVYCIYKQLMELANQRHHQQDKQDGAAAEGGSSVGGAAATASASANGSAGAGSNGIGGGDAVEAGGNFAAELAGTLSESWCDDGSSTGGDPRKARHSSKSLLARLKDLSSTVFLQVVLREPQAADRARLLESNQLCYYVLGLVHTIWSPIPGGLQDYIGSPKTNGYQSLHTTVVPLSILRSSNCSLIPIEVQIRTSDMDTLAELGIAASNWLPRPVRMQGIKVCSPLGRPGEAGSSPAAAAAQQHQQPAASANGRKGYNGNGNGKAPLELAVNGNGFVNVVGGGSSSSSSSRYGRYGLPGRNGSSSPEPGSGAEDEPRSSSNGASSSSNDRMRAVAVVQPDPEARLDADWITQMRKWQDDFVGSLSAREFVDGVTAEVLGQSVFVYTHTGELRRLPRGSTVVDFAYGIHTEVGNEMSAARVNGRIVRPNYVLSNGEVVEILKESRYRHGNDRDDKPTSAALRRRQQWLATVRTRSAKLKIKQYLRDHGDVLQPSDSSSGSLMESSLDALVVEGSAAAAAPSSSPSHQQPQQKQQQQQQQPQGSASAAPSTSARGPSPNHSPDTDTIRNLYVSCQNSKGLLARISSVISDSGYNIETISGKPGDGCFQIMFTIRGPDALLPSMLADIAAVPGVDSYSLRPPLVQTLQRLVAMGVGFTFCAAHLAAAAGTGQLPV